MQLAKESIPSSLHYQSGSTIQELIQKKYSLKKFIESVRLQLDNNMVNGMSIHSFLPGSWETIYTKYSKVFQFQMND